MTGLGMSYLQTDDSFPEWRYGPVNEYQDEIRQLKAEISKLKICLDESKQREEIARKVIDDKNREIEKIEKIMNTLREVAEALCPYRLEDYDPAIDDMSDVIIRMGWINGFLSGAQWREENPVAPGSVPDPESDSIELCGLLWDTENLSIGGYEKDGRRYHTWEEAMDAAKSVGKRLPTREEWKALCNLGSTWDDERKGRWFGGNHDSDHKGSLFLPAAGLRYGNSGEVAGTSSDGYYWSSSPYYGGSYNAGGLYFYSGYVYPLYNTNRAFGFSVRCVRDKE